MTSRILLVGGHGKIALLAAPLLSKAGHHVTSVIRNPDHASDVRDAGATPLVADVERLDTAALADLIQGHDVVVWSAGAGGGDESRTYAVDRDAAIRSMEAAATAGANRYVMVSYFGSSTDHGVPPDNGFFHYAEAKAAADEALRASSLRWTILAPSSLTLDDPTGRIEVGGEASSVTRADVADVIARTVDDDGLVRRTVKFNNGDTPIGDALANPE